MGWVAAALNRKGGSGKSSTVFHVGVELARRGLRTCLVDLDPQASLSMGLLGVAALEIESARTVAGIYDQGFGAADLLMETGRDHLRLIAGHERLGSFNTPDPWLDGADQYLLRDALAEIVPDFDMVLLDLPPHVQANAWSGLMAADGIVVPAPLEDFAILGVAAVLDSIDHARDSGNPRLRLLGLLPSMVSKSTSIHREYDATLREAYPGDVFEATMPLAADFKLAVTKRLGVTEFKPRGVAAKACQAVADELIARLEERCGGGAGETTTIRNVRDTLPTKEVA